MTHYPKVHRLHAALALLILITTIGSATAGQPQKMTSPPTDNPPDNLNSLDQLTSATTRRIEEANSLPELTGSGPYRARLEMDLAFPDATIYRPADLTKISNASLGVLIWGNGGCSNDGASARAHLAEIASHGYLVIAPGKALTGPYAAEGAPAPQLMKITIDHMRKALNWALDENDRAGSPYHGKLDKNAVAVAGHSCGGMLAILLGEDPRISTVIVHNSGIFPVLPDNPPLQMHESRLNGLHTPVLILTGGKSDLATPLAKKAFDSINRLPVILASRDVGHEGTFDHPHGGEAAQMAVHWLQWQLRNDQTAKANFIGDDCFWCTDPQWSIEKKLIP